MGHTYRSQPPSPSSLNSWQEVPVGSRTTFPSRTLLAALWGPMDFPAPIPFLFPPSSADLFVVAFVGWTASKQHSWTLDVRHAATFLVTSHLLHEYTRPCLFPPSSLLPASSQALPLSFVLLTLLQRSAVTMCATRCFRPLAFIFYFPFPGSEGSVVERPSTQWRTCGSN